MFGSNFGSPFGAIGSPEEATPASFLEDLLARRNISRHGGDCVWYLELSGAKIIEPTAFEPDPNTHRNDYYYNAVENVMYTKSKIADGTFVWTRMR